ncbi:MAG: DegV family protein [Bacilli bacterium]|nr:DegV family protein [Bacilli bacterium]
MSKIAIVTDSNSGITFGQAKELGINIIPMPFTINGKLLFEEIDLTNEKFYQLLEDDVNISTSQPSIGIITEMWDKLLTEYDQVVHIPMSSGLSKSCETAMMIAEQDYKDKVFVVNNQRVSVTMYWSVLDAIELAKAGKSGSEIKQILEEQKFNSSIYIALDTLKYLKKGGRITPAAAAIGDLLHLKPVLQIQGEKLDAFEKVIGMRKAKSVMIKQMRKDFDNRFHGSAENMHLCVAYSKVDEDFLQRFIDDIKKEFSDIENLTVMPLSLSISCHIGPGAFAIACSKKIEY